MKKKTIEVYLPPNFNESNGSIHVTTIKCRDSGPRARLTFYPPEDKVEITESEFFESVKSAFKENSSMVGFIALRELIFKRKN